MEKTARGERLHIGIFGMRNAGKSSLLNAITDQETSLVSDYKGTTTDPVYKNMELHGIGPVVFVDTAGYDDSGELGRLRVEKTKKAVDKCDMALLIITRELWEKDVEFHRFLKSKGIPVISILGKADMVEYHDDFIQRWQRETGEMPYKFAVGNRGYVDSIIKIIESFNKEKNTTITGKLAKEKSLVILVTPQDKAAPKGRLILPQVQTIRELLDKHSIVMVIQQQELGESLGLLNKSPDLVITDSQIFKEVYDILPREVALTSFSVLFAAYKGDLDYFIASVKSISSLNENSTVLIAEACTHPPISEDIGRVKIPMMLRKLVGQGLTIDFVRGDDFDLDKDYDLIIHCGACMFNRKHVVSRIEVAKEKEIPMTNYGVVIAYLKGILDQTVIP